MLIIRGIYFILLFYYNSKSEGENGYIPSLEGYKLKKHKIFSKI